MQSGNHLENLIKHTVQYHGITYFIVGGQYLWILRQTLKIYA